MHAPVFPNLEFLLRCQFSFSLSCKFCCFFFFFYLNYDFTLFLCLVCAVFIFASRARNNIDTTFRYEKKRFFLYNNTHTQSKREVNKHDFHAKCSKKKTFSLYRYVYVSFVWLHNIIDTFTNAIDRFLFFLRFQFMVFLFHSILFSL